MDQIQSTQTDPLKQEMGMGDFDPSTLNQGGSAHNDTGGPQFGMDDGGWRKKVRKWLNKYGSSVILPIIALFILAGGIYLYARQKTESAIILPEEKDFTVQDIQEEMSDLTEKETAAPLSTEDETIEKIVPQQKQESGSITKKAEKGEGVTHLARQALKDYLEDNQQNLSNEHKIYIEDYLKDKIGSKTLEVGDEIIFSENLIKEAIEASNNLSQEQLKSLEKYSILVAW